MIMEKIKEYKNGSVKVNCTFSLEEQEMFRTLARKKKKKFDDKFISNELLKALKDRIKNDTKYEDLNSLEKDC